MSRTVELADAMAMTVGEVMIERPKTLPADARVGDVRQAFERPSVRSALLADGERFAGVVEREDLPSDAPDDAPASAYVRADAVTVTPAMPMRDAVALLEGRAEPRLVVLDEDGVTLRGLLCGNATATGFCRR
ncbi:MAG: CBS domain-containing protein [Solirubrobacterales bacterium]|nr:CBS domain-containing protein [Solirubrobacterales bacterium]